MNIFTPSRVMILLDIHMLRIDKTSHLEACFSDLQKYLAATPEEYTKINYANNKAEYSTVITSLTAQRRHYLLMDFYDDMMLDGVKPGRDTFHSLLISTMKGARLQDAFFFRDQSMIFIPDLMLIECQMPVLQQAVGNNEGPKKGSHSTRRKLMELVDLKCKVVDFSSACWTYKQFTDDNFGLSLAFVLSLKLATCYLILTVMITLTEMRSAIVQDITDAGLGLNKFCYAGLIAAHKNKEPVRDDLAS
ncbi:hypothetical protein BC332_18240 [Capsicum chinense]|nr:hypothetical protein BC332_18240 [Capsicum chinense]